MLALAFGPSVGAQQDPKQQREQVRQQKATAAQDVNALEADAASVQQALADLQANVAGQEASLSDATFAAKQAELQASTARAEAAAAAARVVQIRGELRSIAVEAYVGGDAAQQAASSGGEGTEAQASFLRQAYIGFQSAKQTQVFDSLRAAEDDTERQRTTAEAAAATAEAKRAESQQRTSQVRAARVQQSAYGTQVQNRLDQRLAEAAGLESLDRNLSAQIAQQEAALAARAPAGASRGGPVPVADFPLTTVRGITVASSIADQLARLLDAADASGVSLGGSGYRDPRQQQALRNRNCPDPINSPPGACSPPTARAGTSMHEQGVAIDFTEGATVLRSGSAGYQWLAANAGRFGFSNLPSEPWHWSTNGR
ncbi:MAG: D-alanyl-D-alanine carboxypeptidase family protein [Acidimicrobiales bacterium]